MDDKIVLITGGTRGIGKATAIKFAQNGYKVIVNYTSFNDIEKYKIEMRKLAIDNNIYLIKNDITSYSGCQNMVKEVINVYGKVDVLVNNAGITKDKLLLMMDEDDFNDVINVNLKGMFNITKSVIPYMIKSKQGRIVNISSVVGTNGNIGQINYSASKAGIIGFSKSLAKEYASRNILVNIVAPGFIDTNMTNKIKEEVKENIKESIPLRRLGKPEEVANLIYFLGSDNNTYITGELIKIDGGLTI